MTDDQRMSAILNNMAPFAALRMRHRDDEWKPCCECNELADDCKWHLGGWHCSACYEASVAFHNGSDGDGN